MLLIYSPGYVRTNIIQELTAKQRDEFYERFGAKYPVGRCGEGVDIANAVAYLCSGQSSFITGSILVADGGHLVANVFIEHADADIQ